MKKLLFYLMLPFMPHYWLMNDKYSKEWDATLNMLMSKYDFTQLSECVALLGETQIWVSNHPYASMTLYNGQVYAFGRPSRYTIFKAYKKFKMDAILRKDADYKEALNNICQSINQKEGFAKK